jgi:hypothetical protein
MWRHLVVWASLTGFAVCAAMGRAAEVPPDDPAAGAAKAADLLESALKEGRALAEGGRHVDRRRLYEQACDKATAMLSTPSDSGAALAKALKAAADAEDSAAADRLAGAMKEAVARLRFKPRREADLPRGFPPPGPVGEVIVKQYPSYRAARAEMADAGPKRGQNEAFGVLFNHIQTHDIAMTAPVEMTYRQDAAPPPVEGGAGDGRTPANAPAENGRKLEMAATAMAFLYASTDLGKAGREGDVDVIDVPPMTVVSIGVQGDYTERRMAEAVAKLRAWLSHNEGGHLPDGPPRYLGYNSPFNLPWLKYGEVQIPIKKKTP